MVALVKRRDHGSLTGPIDRAFGKAFWQVLPAGRPAKELRTEQELNDKAQQLYQNHNSSK